jgi:hypothetical protein
MLEVVHAKEINETRIYYSCQYCDKTHVHGNMEVLDNYEHHRGCHCKSAGAPTDVKIIVDNNTVRNFNEIN